MLDGNVEKSKIIEKLKNVDKVDYNVIDKVLNAFLAAQKIKKVKNNKTLSYKIEYKKVCDCN